jgi:hypothetical protein
MIVLGAGADQSRDIAAALATLGLRAELAMNL